jgi:hypothetical protein
MRLSIEFDRQNYVAHVEKFLWWLPFRLFDVTTVRGLLFNTSPLSDNLIAQSGVLLDLFTVDRR